MRRLHLLFLLAAVLTLLLTACGSLNAANRSNPSDELAVRAILTDDEMPGFTGGSRSGIDTGCGSWSVSLPLNLLSCAFGSYMTNEAYSGEGRAQIDAQARADGNDPETMGAPGSTPEPDRPIHGIFVSTHHGIFELYNRAIIFDSPEDAHENLWESIDGARSSLSGFEEVPSGIGDESVTFKGLTGPDPQTYEMQFLTQFRRGRVVVSISTMGSPDLKVEENWRLAGILDSRIEADPSVDKTFPMRLAPTPGPTVSCADERQGQGGFVVRLPVGASLTPAVLAPFLAESNQALSDAGLGNLYVADTDDTALLPDGAEVLSPLYFQARDPDLCTDDFRLDTPPAATALRDAARKYLIDNGIVSIGKFVDGSTQWYLADDVLPDGLVAVYALLQTPSPYDGRDVVMTVFEGKDGPILGAARVNLYAADIDDAGSCPPASRFQSGYLVRLDPASVAEDPFLVGPLLSNPPPALSALGYGELYVETGPRNVEDKPLYLMAADPELHTCDYQLADRPVAKAMRESAADYLIKNGIVSTDDIQKPSTVWMISDTDLPGGTITVYTQLQSSDLVPDLVGDRQVFVTVFQSKAGPIIGAAKVNLCPADSPNGGTGFQACSR
jgi:hypothetical protein